MAPTPDQIHRLVERCEPFRQSKAPLGYPHGLALCIVDSVQSTGVTYSSVEKVVKKYREHRRAQGAEPNTDSADQLIATFDELGGPEGWSRRIGNQNKTSTRAGAPSKAFAILEAARVLTAERIHVAEDLRIAAGDPERIEVVQSAWLTVPGQRSGITWHYMQMLAGIEGIKPDRMITRFVADSLEVPRKTIKTHFAYEILMATAAEMAVSPRDLDHGIWQWQRQRR